MELYAGSSAQFIEDTFRHRIALKLTENFQRQMGYRPSQSEIRAWENSLQAMSQIVQRAGFQDQGILLEYQLPLSSRRLDCFITGRRLKRQPSAVVVELKQWGACQPSDVPDCVVAFVGGRERVVLHPSRQAGQYRDYLVENQEVFENDAILVDACAYLHNLQFDVTDEFHDARHQEVLERFPIFTGDQSPQLTDYLTDRLGHGEGMDVLGAVMDSRYRPSKKLLENTAAMVLGQEAYVLLDEQLVVFNAVLQQAKEGFHAKGKVVILVNGGPGTGKSVLALHLVGRLSQLGVNAQHATGSKAFTANIKKIVKQPAAQQFRFYRDYAHAEPNAVDVLILDEAHRIRENSTNRFNVKSATGKPQIDELIEASKVSVYFIDDRQVVRPREVGSSTLIRDGARRHGAEFFEFDLETQFRCGGSESYVNWVETTLDIRRTQNVLWDGDDGFDVQILDSVYELEQGIRAKNSQSSSARLSAGFCWPWSEPKDGKLVSDVQIGDWAMPWNAKSGNGAKLPPGVPAENYWATDPRGIDQVGCVYTAQGFEFDYVGVIWGPDLRYDPRKNTWVGDSNASHDFIVKRSGQNFTELVKNTYRVLLTRGLKGCYIYFVDENTRNFVSSRMTAR